MISTNYAQLWNAMTCISQLIEGGVYYTVHGKKKLQDLSVWSLNICHGLFPQMEKKREKTRVQVYWMEGKTELPLNRTDSCVPFPI